MDYNYTRDDLIQNLNIDMDNEIQAIESLFCAALLTNCDTKDIANITGKYIELKDILFNGI